MKNYDKVLRLFISLTEKAVQAGKRRIDLGYDLPLFRSEIHTIEIIGRSNGIHISEIAREMGVTKGAISQRIIVFENKGLIQKINDPENHSRILVRLAEKGRNYFVAHSEYHNEKDKDMFDYLREIDENEIRIIEEFLIKANQFCERHI